MTPTDEFLEWLHTRHHEAAFALHDGDAEPKNAIWSSGVRDSD